MHVKNLLALAALAVLSGCWTFNESTYPKTECSPSPAATNIAVAVVGFQAVLPNYATLTGYNMAYVPGHYGPHHYHPGYYEMVATPVVVEQAATTDAFLQRARTGFEDVGFIIGAPTPQWTVEVVFGRTALSSADRTCEWLWPIGTLFFCDFGATECTATLKIRDNRTGRLAFHRDYLQRYETNVFSPIPLFGIGQCEKTTLSYMLSWCYSALTDRILADATDYLTQPRNT